MSYFKQSEREVVGLIPAGGKASRVAPLPCSKELYPVGFRHLDNNDLRPKVISQYLLEKMQKANIKKAYIILREGKWDIPSYFGDGRDMGMHFAYLLMDLPYGVPFTLDQAYPFVRDSVVALGFPDTIFQPDNSYLQLIEKLDHSRADIVLGLFPAHQPHKTDMVEIDAQGLVRSIHIKPDSTHLHFAWEIAVWTPIFTKFMHDYLEKLKKINNENSMNELFVGDVIQSAIEENIAVQSVLFQDGACLDIGTPEDMIRAIKASIETDNV